MLFFCLFSQLAHIWCTGTLELETLMCDEEKKCVCASLMEKGVMHAGLLCVTE